MRALPCQQVWLYMRERKDKETPNAMHVYESVVRSIEVGGAVSSGGCGRTCSRSTLLGWEMQHSDGGEGAGAWAR